MNPDNQNRILVTYACRSCGRVTSQPTVCRCGDCRFEPVATLTTPIRIEYPRKSRKKAATGRFRVETTTSDGQRVTLYEGTIESATKAEAAA